MSYNSLLHHFPAFSMLWNFFSSYYYVSLFFNSGTSLRNCLTSWALRVKLAPTPPTLLLRYDNALTQSAADWAHSNSNLLFLFLVGTAATRTAPRAVDRGPRRRVSTLLRTGKTHLPGSAAGILRCPAAPGARGKGNIFKKSILVPPKILPALTTLRHTPDLKPR